MGLLKEPPMLEDDSDEDYSLDKIVERQVINGEVRYFLKWDCNKKEFKTIKRNLECPVIMDSFERVSKDKKSAKGSETREKKNSVQNCSTPMTDVSEAEKKQVHSKISKIHVQSQSKKAESDEKLKGKKQKHASSEEHTQNECKIDEKMNSSKVSQQSETSETTEVEVITSHKLTSSPLEETVAEK